MQIIFSEFESVYVSYTEASSRGSDVATEVRLQGDALSAVYAFVNTLKTPHKTTCLEKHSP